ADHVADLIGRRARDPVGGAFAPRRIHAHVERTICLEAESPRGVVKLRRRHAEVEENPCTLTSVAMCRDQWCERAERSADHHHARLLFEARASGGDGFWIAIDREQPVVRTKALEYPRGMPA